MKRTRRIIAIFELLKASGGRGLTREEILSRLRGRGLPVEMRQLERDLLAMRTTLDFPVASSDDVTDEQSAKGARVVYFINRLGQDSKALLSSGKSIAWFESAGCGVWGRPMDAGHVILHHERASSPHEVIDSFAKRFPASRVLYLGQYLFIHFFIEVSMFASYDIELRIGRLSKAPQHPPRDLPQSDVLLGFAGYPAMSRLFGPHGGHVAIRFPAGALEVIATDLSAAAGGSLAELEQLSGFSREKTPVVCMAQMNKHLVLNRSGQLTFGGAVMSLVLPTA